MEGFEKNIYIVASQTSLFMLRTIEYYLQSLINKGISIDDISHRQDNHGVHIFVNDRLKCTFKFDTTVIEDPKIRTFNYRCEVIQNEKD